jgi:hypothetical protein
LVKKQKEFFRVKNLSQELKFLHQKVPFSNANAN